ncbi:MAG: hypothetical protein KDJ34_01935 [Candidatus Competibacteraceae bacterium]|nr:hypothetical protein [Candidatus Competibacteraceae bacterium]MCP5134378.1 hypothetical protein [Gammaproteobacteria bacterium]
MVQIVNHSAKRRAMIIACFLAALPAGCANSPKNAVQLPIVPPQSGLSEKARQEQQQAILKVHHQTLRQLYRLKPLTKAEIQQAAGYGMFEINGLNAILAETHGRGVVFEKATGKATYMHLARTDLQPGATLQPYRQVLIFHNAQKLKQFIASGSPANISSDPDIKVYRLNTKGIAVQADWGARYFPDTDLNETTPPPGR